MCPRRRRWEEEEEEEEVVEVVVVEEEVRRTPGWRRWGAAAQEISSIANVYVQRSR